MMPLLIHRVLTCILILMIARQVKGVEVDSWWAALCGAVVLGLLNVVLLPVVTLVTLPFTLVTFSLFLFVLHACRFRFSAAIVAGFRVNGFVPALCGSILLTLFDLVISVFL